MSYPVLIGIFIAAALVAWLSTFVVRRFAIRIGCIDEPNERKIHAVGTPRLGGLAIVLGFATPLLAIPLDERAAELVSKNFNYLFAVLLSGSLMIMLGVYDDLFGSNAYKKFTVQILAAAILIGFGFRFEFVSLPFVGVVQLGLLGYVVTLLWIVGVINAMNFIDGMDGLAAVVGITIAMTFAIIAMIRGDVFTLVIMVALGGSLAGFLPWNRRPASIFMGDSGSLFIGLLLAASSIARNSKSPTAFVIAGPALALALPVLDTLLVMKGRFQLKGAPLSERFSKMLNADKTHVHHILIEKSGSWRKAIFSIWIITLAFGIAAVLSILDRTRVVGYSLAALNVLILIALRLREGKMHRFSQRAIDASQSLRKRSEFDRQERGQ